MSGVWVFGYGSLVSPDSFGDTVGRSPIPGVDFHGADLRGYGRRWNYGVTSAVGESIEPDGTTRSWTIVALGLVASTDEVVNGVIGWVTDDELPAVDRRERQYDRVDVTQQTTVLDGVQVDAPIVTYLPRDEAVQRYEAARDRGEAAIEQRYWDLVDRAFADLGGERRRQYRATTPDPDVPIVPMRRDSVPVRHRGRGRP